MTTVFGNATTDSRGQRYYTWRGQRYWSVTTILSGGFPKPALIGWAKKFTAEYAVEHFEAFGMLVHDDPAGAVEWLKGAAFRDRDRKAELGTATHSAVEAYVLEKPFPEWSIPVRPRMEGFLAWLEHYEPDFHVAEVEIYNQTENYAGRLDAIATIAGRKYLIDYKTTKDIYPEVALQLAAYRYAEFMGMPDGSEIKMPEVDDVAVLHLPEGGGYSFIRVKADESVLRAFQYVREVFRFEKDTSKTVLLGPVPRDPAMIQATLPLEGVA